MAPGAVILGSGKAHCGSLVEDLLESRRPEGMVPRPDAVYMMAEGDVSHAARFSYTLADGEVYRVRPVAGASSHDIAFVGALQKARDRDGSMFPVAGPRWSDRGAMDALADGYWSGSEMEPGKGLFEWIAPSVRVLGLEGIMDKGVFKTARVTGKSHERFPECLGALARELDGRGWDAAKRLVVSKVGSVGRGERFDDDVADAVFLRLQENSQVGRYASESLLSSLGRNAVRLPGGGAIELFRAAPPGSGIRPGDFAAASAHEAGYYLHGGNKVQRATVPRVDVFSVDGSMGGEREYVHLPVGYVAPVPVVYFRNFRDFYSALHSAPKDSVGPFDEPDMPASSALPGMR